MEHKRTHSLRSFSDIQCMIYEWRYVENYSQIVGFGLSETETVVIRIDFYPYFYIESSSSVEHGVCLPNGNAICTPLKIVKCERRIMRGAYSEKSSLKSMSKIYFENASKMRKFAQICEKENINIYEHDLDIEEMFITESGLNVASIIKAKCFKCISKITHIDKEYQCLIEDIKLFDYVNSKALPVIIEPLILCVDIEAYSSVTNMMPDPDLEANIAFLISVIVWRYQSASLKKYILHCCDVKIQIEEVEIRSFSCETDMLKGYFALINEINPDVITGYNIFKFDFHYIRYRLKRKIITIPSISRLINGKTEEKEMNWYSSAYGFNDYLILDAAGRCSFDLYQYVSREYILSSYSLSSVAKKFIGDEKFDLSAKEMFYLYKDGTSESIIKIAKYCLQDSILVKRLFDEMNVWVSLIELSKATGVGLRDLYTRGQQIRVLSQLHKECHNLGIIMDRPKSNIRPDYEGAYVIDPQPGIYRWCFSLDFSSLYPSIIISYNICYSTLVKNNDVNNEECYIINIGEKQYRFLKNPQGIVPRLLKKLIDERKATKIQMKNESKPIAKVVLDKRQWALKISANSVYGSYGTRNVGYLQFIEGAECTTAVGRESMRKAIHLIEEEYPVKVIYGDTDSCIMTCPDLIDLETSEAYKICVEMAEGMASNISSKFPPPLRLEFDNVCQSFLIISKKQYAGLVITINSDNSGLSSKISFKGVIPVRRDRCEFLRKTYQDALEMILRDKTEIEVHSYLRDRLFDLITGNINISYLTIKRSLNNSYKNPSNPQLLFANKLREKGEIVEPGTKLEFVYVKRARAEKLQGNKMELPDTVKFEDIDILYYLEKHISSPIDNLLKASGMKTFVEQFGECIKYHME